MVSFTGIVTFKNAPAVHDCAARVGAGDFMVETDCPYLAPGALPRETLRAGPHAAGGGADRRACAG